MRSYATILHEKIASLGVGCFHCGGERHFGDFCYTKCHRHYYRHYYAIDGPTVRWERTELAAEREYQQQWATL